MPFPPRDGGCLGIHNFSMGLLEAGHELKIMAINTPKHFTKINSLPTEYLQKTNIEAIFVDTDVKTIPAFLNLFSSKSYNVTRFYSKELEEKLSEVLQKNTFDIIQLESIFMCPYLETIRKNSKAKIILRAHNVEHIIWERLAENEKNSFKKIYLQLLSKRLKKYEMEQFNRVDGITTVTLDDLEIIKKSGCKKSIQHIPFAIDIEHLKPKPEVAEPFSLFHLGAMDWMPNQEGIRWFIDHVWGKLHEKNPTLKFYIAGRNMPDWLLKLAKKNIFVAGEIEDSISFIQSKSVMIVPLFSGGGIRVKIIEGLALGKAIIATSIAAEGISYENKKNIFIANLPKEFIECIEKIIFDADLLKNTGENARKLAEEMYDIKKIIFRLTQFYSEILNPTTT
ncbi:MAG: glycosyltransferase family 4 protein [Bacteroidia bacterium]